MPVQHWTLLQTETAGLGLQEDLWSPRQHIQVRAWPLWRMLLSCHPVCSQWRLYRSSSNKSTIKTTAPGSRVAVGRLETDPLSPAVNRQLFQLSRQWGVSHLLLPRARSLLDKTAFLNLASTYRSLPSCLLQLRPSHILSSSSSSSFRWATT